MKCIGANHEDENRMLPLGDPLYKTLLFAFKTLCLQRISGPFPLRCDIILLRGSQKAVIKKKRGNFFGLKLFLLCWISSHTQYLQHLCTLKWRLWAWVVLVHFGFLKNWNFFFLRFVFSPIVWFFWNCFWMKLKT